MLDACPAETLKAHPFAILVLMRRMFTWRKIPKMMELKVLLLTAIAEHPELSDEERGNLLGECDLILSFLCYNDIRAMSRLHRSASRQMTRPAISIQNSGGWTFGSPSVLMMFHRAPGELPGELSEMDECMPHYYKITGGHGQGAETIMRAEAAYMQGRFTDAHIALEHAYAQSDGSRQENMSLCRDFLARRLSLFADVEQRYTFEARYAALHGEAYAIPKIFSEHKLSSVNILAPGKPMTEMIENQVYLAQGSYAKVIGRSAELLAACEGMHYALVALHIRIQTAAAYEMLGKAAEAHAALSAALSDAAPDSFVIPFAENYSYLESALAREIQDDFIAQIIAIGETAKQRKEKRSRPPALAALTEREIAIVKLMPSMCPRTTTVSSSPRRPSRTITRTAQNGCRWTALLPKPPFWTLTYWIRTAVSISVSASEVIGSCEMAATCLTHTIPHK